MPTSFLGLLAGLLLAVAAATGGFTGFLLALILGTVGFALGAWRDGTLDIRQFMNGRSRG